MKLLWFVTGYFVISLMLYIVCRAKCKKNAVFRMPKNKWVFYILSFTWGLPTVVIGAIIALFVRLAGHKPKRYGWEWCFEIPNLGWGLELGLFFIAPTGHESVHMHEHGHGIQNIYLGIFDPLVVSVPSVVRFWYREIREKFGKPCKTKYDDAWFEKSATESGKAFIKRLKDEQK